MSRDGPSDLFPYWLQLPARQVWRNVIHSTSPAIVIICRHGTVLTRLCPIMLGQCSSAFPLSSRMYIMPAQDNWDSVARCDPLGVDTSEFWALLWSSGRSTRRTIQLMDLGKRHMQLNNHIHWLWSAVAKLPFHFAIVLVSMLFAGFYVCKGFLGYS